MNYPVLAAASITLSLAVGGMSSPLPVPTIMPCDGGEQVGAISGTKAAREHLSGDTGFGLRWSPQGTYFVFAVSTGQYLVNDEGNTLTSLTSLLLVNPKTGECKVLAKNGKFPVWSPSGQKIAYVTQQEADRSAIMVTDLTKDSAAQVIEEGVFAQWLDDQHLLVVGTDNSVRAIDLDTGSKRDLNIAVSTSGPNSILISPDRTWLAVVKESSLSLLNLHSTKPPQVISDTFTDIVGSLAWSPTSDRLAFVANKAVQIVQTHDLAVRFTVYEWQGRGFPSELNWLSGGDKLAFHSPEGVKFIDLTLSSNKVESDQTDYDLSQELPGPALGELISPLPTPTLGTKFDVRAAALTAVQLYFPNRGDKFDILLQRKVTRSEFASLGLNQPNFLQEPPLELVLLQGEFDISSIGRGALGQPAKYLVLVFNLDTRTITYRLALTKGDTIEPLLALAAQVTPVPVTPVPTTPLPVEP